MCDFGEVCDNAENWFTCRFILLIAAPKINFSILQSFILYMTYYQFVHAQLYTSQTDSGALTQQSSRVKSECKASTRRTVNGLNYFAASGSEPFDDLFSINQ
ncbi:unnamed protein product [Rotaria sp. Silwood2]|nr:unnamed protein product [Rotaria sp. Silwood2]CAF4496546.1 unnamed protein product [Rotaria sp. Silwood2]CAF4524347.1 unnamed protein product [Rotaria sp. Silwood2]CAF4870579.1 unnamed protein product [Rotaria sp. Silwood2]